MNKTYDSKDIVVLEGLDAVRLRPGMYIGTTGIKGLHHILWEIVDNAIDEVSNGFGNRISITLHKDGSASVEDNGRGIPVDMHPTLHKSGVEVVFTQLHAGGKFNNDNYGYSGGLHGVGASVTNALSLWTKVYVCKNKKRYFMEFESKADEKGKIRSGIPVAPLMEIGDTTKTGTKVTFMPDPRVFESVVFNAETILKRLKELAFLNKGVYIEFSDERTGQKQVFAYEGGLKDFAIYLNENKTPLYKDPVYISGESKLVKLELAMQHTDTYTENMFSYVNNIPTSEGGTHETGFKSALTRLMNELAREQGWLKEKEQNLIGEDFREGITAILSIKMRNIQFEGQTKTKLGNPEIRPEVDNIVYNELLKFFEQKDNMSIAEIIFNKAKGASKVREAQRKAKDLARQKNSVDKY
ncbi:MAG: DNA topoisomerase IV subunit B, partial [Eubacteriales bacterium]|nr:DNA topoisomerase IV subunit B [Eubacteriales bacterium]